LVTSTCAMDYTNWRESQKPEAAWARYTHRGKSPRAISQTRKGKEFAGPNLRAWG